MKFFGVKELFFKNSDLKNECKNEFHYNNENHAADSKIRAPPKIDFKADGTQESHLTAWWLIQIGISLFIQSRVFISL